LVGLASERIYHHDTDSRIACVHSVFSRKRATDDNLGTAADFAAAAAVVWIHSLKRTPLTGNNLKHKTEPSNWLTGNSLILLHRLRS